MMVIRYFGMREFKYGIGVIDPNFLLNLLLVKMSEKSLSKADFRRKNKKDMSDNGSIDLCLEFNNLGCYYQCILLYFRHRSGISVVQSAAWP